MNAILVSILSAATSLLGATAQEVGAPDPAFWCHDMVNAAAGTAFTGPIHARQDTVPFEPLPGGIVTTDLFHANDTPEHVAVIEAVHPDGSLTVIQGNGAPDPEHVTRAHVPAEDVHSTGITAEAHGAYLAGLCAQLQEAKPWIEWGCP